MSLAVLRARWFVLLTLVGLLIGTAAEPIDTVAVLAFEQGAELAVSSTLAQGVDLRESPSLAAPEVAGGSRLRAVEQAYHEVIARRPLDPQPWRMLGDLHTAWGRPDDAFYAYNQALRRDDESAALGKSQARLVAILGDTRRSARHWGNYLSRWPDDRSARLAYAWTAIRLAEWEHARAELERLLADDPGDLFVHAWLGLLLIGPEASTGTHHLQLAADDPILAAFLAPVFAAERLSTTDNNPAYRSALLGVSLLDLNIATLLQQPWLESGRPGRVVEEELRNVAATLALRSLLVAVYRNPIYADAYAYLGQAFDQLGWPHWAQISLGYAQQLTPESPVVQTLAGLYWDRRGVPALARHYFEMAYSQDQENVTLCLEIAASYLAESEYTSGEVWLLHAADIAPDDPLVWEMLAQYYLDLGIDVEESGLAAARRFLELAPNDAHAHELMGWASYLINEDAAAEANLSLALALDPALASVHYHMGRLHARQGLYAEAARDYRRATDYDLAGRWTVPIKRAWGDLPPAYRDGS